MLHHPYQWRISSRQVHLDSSPLDLARFLPKEKAPPKVKDLQHLELPKIPTRMINLLTWLPKFKLLSIRTKREVTTVTSLVQMVPPSILTPNPTDQTLSI
jgi:hypothetical protein